MEKERRWEEKDKDRKKGETTTTPAGVFAFTESDMKQRSPFENCQEYWERQRWRRREGNEHNCKHTLAVRRAWQTSRLWNLSRAEEPALASKAFNSFSLLHLVAGGTMCVAGGISAEMCVLYLFVCSKCRDRWGPRGVFLSCGFEPVFTPVLVGSVGKIFVIYHFY